MCQALHSWKCSTEPSWKNPPSCSICVLIGNRDNKQETKKVISIREKNKAGKGMGHVSRLDPSHHSPLTEVGSCGMICGLWVGNLSAQEGKCLCKGVTAPGDLAGVCCCMCLTLYGLKRYFHLGSAIYYHQKPGLPLLHFDEIPLF